MIASSPAAGQTSNAGELCDEAVRFRFHLPPALLVRAPIGDWPRAPRGVVLHVGPGGQIRVSARNGSESYARGQVLQTAASFLRSIDHNLAPATFRAELTPANGEAPIRYAITIGARVSIARTAEEPAVFE
jgi:hypothetical protein